MFQREIRSQYSQSNSDKNDRRMQKKKKKFLRKLEELA